MKCARVQLPELLRGDLSEEESRRVLDHLEECPSCRERARVMALLQGEPSLLARRKRGVWRLYLALAAALCLVVLGLAVHMRPSRTEPAPDAERLATSVPYPLIPLTIRSAETEEDARMEAFEAYRRGDFAGAAVSFSRLESAAGDGDVRFFWGVAAYLAGDPRAARRHLQRASELSGRWAEPSLWYLANLELKSGDTEAARDRLETLRARRGEFGEAAKRLIEALERAR